MNVYPFSFLPSIAIYSNLPPMQPHQQEVDPFSLLLGIVIAGVVGFLIFRLSIWWGGVSKMWKKQTVVHTTDRTPLDVVLEGLFRLAVLIAIGLALFWLINNIDWGGVIP